MRKQVIVFIAVIAIITLLAILAGCSGKTPSMQLIPPLPKVVSEKTDIPVTQSSYCWAECRDCVGGKVMVEGQTPTVVTPEANIKVYFDYKPAPNQLSVQQFQEGKDVEVPLKKGYFKAPKDKGIYYYGVSAYWYTDDGKYSKGDTSVVFVIEVK